jgi:hypothetical protein
MAWSWEDAALGAAGGLGQAYMLKALQQKPTADEALMPEPQNQHVIEACLVAGGVWDPTQRACIDPTTNTPIDLGSGLAEAAAAGRVGYDRSNAPNAPNAPSVRRPSLGTPTDLIGSAAEIFRRTQKKGSS